MGKFIWLQQIRSLLLVLFLLSKVDCSLSLSSSSLNPTPVCLPEDTSALLQFKNTMSIDDSGIDYCLFTSYPKTNSWNESTNCCSWEGVTCDKVNGQVIGLDLSCSLLSGSFPSNSSLFHLQGLKQLNLAYNNFNGSSIPFGFGQLVSLTHLNLSRSFFSGLVPSDISLLSKLISLDLSKHNAYLLKFDDHNFDMLARNLSELEYLLLDYVNMSNIMPTSFINLSSSLKRLSLHYCDLQGEFPSEIFQLRHLEYLDLNWNSLSGYLPKSNWSSPLRLLDLKFNDFGGSISASLENLTKITFLDLSFNEFEGQIPDVFGNLNKLITLHVFGCNFSGQLPSSLFNLTQLTFMDLSSNRLYGLLPTQVSRLQTLEILYLNDNFLSGAIPSWLFTLPSLELLDLSGNRLTGPISKIQKPNSIRHVYLENNDIHGEIPSSFFDLANLTQLDLSSNNLNGVIKSFMLSKLENLETLDLSKNKLLSLGSDSDVNSNFQELYTLSFSSCNLRRFPNFLRSAKNLRVLDLSYNKIEGSIFKWESEGWEQLITLNLSHNLLTGFEQSPGNYLETLDLRSNRLQGPLPAPPPFLREFLISENELTGEIPPSICNMTSLEILDLSRNYLGGIIPMCLVNFSREISTIKLEMNSFRGKIPDYCVDDNNFLITLALNDNQLEGPLPQSLIHCTFLRILNLANNKLRDTFPHWLGTLTDLQVLILRSNRFHGPLKIANCYEDLQRPFSSLQIVDLSQNEFTGLLPIIFFENLDALKHKSNVSIALLLDDYGSVHKEFIRDGHISVNVTSKRSELELELIRTLLIFIAIDFSNNRFHGKIPEAIGELRAIKMLNLSHNSFTSDIPLSLGNLVDLESLDLSSNKFSGRIPSQLTSLTFLEVLNFSENNLVGPIPLGNQFNTFENDSYYGNLGLCGFPLSKQCGSHDGPKRTAPKFKEDEGTPIAFLWKIAMMGYGCGLVLGLSTGYIVFTTGRPWWFVRMVERDCQRNVTRWICRVRGRRNNNSIQNALRRSN